MERVSLFTLYVNSSIAKLHQNNLRCTEKIQIPGFYPRATELEFLEIGLRHLYLNEYPNV